MTASLFSQPLSTQLPFTMEPPKCITEDGSWCAEVWRLTGNEWLAASAGWLVAKPLKILLIFIVAFVIRLLVRRLIDRLTSGEGKTPALLRPLKERAPQALGALVSERRQQRAKTIGSVLKSLVTFIVYGLAFIMALGELGVNLGPVIASAGIVGVALGFGAQNLVKDFLSGIFMMLEDQYGVGDVVDVGEASGTIEAVGLRVTTLRDVNGTVWYVRNGEILRVGNSSQGFAVAVVDLPVGYGADVDVVIALLDRVSKEVAGEEPFSSDVIEAPEVLGVEKVTPESVTVRMTVKVRPGRQWAVQRALRARAMGAVEEAGIQPPMGRLFPPTAPA
ncbi:small conductance mechanosensitive channel [Actinokineospora baliensis]|uniref:mechanosensitive ion channel family protein n=1 Tax=Actinokineospora baliensis TaxID=547056 RepID=UPI0019566B52|nr:mechanosensitive ion channel family protein [Actinokineospora baliensis]MBM7772438.1 small conductance mechanosensitive channel [Actinokineospora baliensis]